MRKAAFVLLLLGLLMTGLIGTGRNMVFLWPGYAAFGLVGVLGAFAWRKVGRVRANDVCLLTALLFAVYVVIRALTSPIAYLAREDLLLVVACFIIYGVTALWFTRSRERNIVIWVLLGLGLFNLVLGLYHFAGGGNEQFSIIPGYSRSYAEGRVGGLFNNPNHMAAFVGFLAVASFSIVFFGRGKASSKLVLLFGGVMMTVAVILTVSRGGIVGYGVGLAVLAALGLLLVWHLYRHIFFRLSMVVGVLAFVALAGGVFLSLGFLKDRATEKGIFDETARTKFWRAAIDQFSLQPVTGTGSRTYYYYSRKFRPEVLQFDTAAIEYTHNEYLELLAEYGIIGTALCGLFVLVHVFSGLKYVRWFCRERYPSTRSTTNPHLGLVVGMIAGLAVGAAHAVVEFQCHIPAVAMLYAFALGVLANPGFDQADYRPPRLRGVRAVTLLGGIAGGLFLVFGAFKYGRAEYFLEKARHGQGEELNLEVTLNLNKTKELDPVNHRAYFMSGAEWMANVRTGMPPAMAESFLSKALAEFEAAHRLFPQDVYTLMSMGNCLDGLGRPDAAENYFLEALKWAPVYQSTRLAYAVHLHRMQRWDEAARAYEHAKVGHPLVHHNVTRPYVESLIARLEEDRRKAEGPQDEAPVPAPEPSR